MGTGYSTFAYEDQYPHTGDYDMNDVLMNVRFTEYQLNEQVIRVKIEGQVAALGGDYHSGFAIRLPDTAREMIKADSVTLMVNSTPVVGEILETDTNDAIFIIHQDLWQTTNAGEAQNCTMFRTQANCGTSYRATWQLQFSFNSAPSNNQMPDFPYDPFIFASPGHYFGDIGYQLTGSYPGRGLEIHLKNNAPTSKFDSRYLQLGNDASTGNTHFHNSNGLPWGIEIPSDWQHPLERTTILQAYPQFSQFAQDSENESATSWYMNPVLEKIYVD
jgi:LruC domain-containing protein